MNCIYKIFIICSLIFLSSPVQADQLADKLTTLKDNGLIPLKAKLRQLKGALGKLKHKLAYPAVEIVDTAEEFTAKIVERRFKGKKFDKKELEKYAEGYIEGVVEKDGYGYKTANLHELNKVAKALNLRSIQVPDFVGISSYNVKEFLKKRGYNVETAWKTFVGQFDQSQRDQFFKTKNFTQQFLIGLKVIEDKIKEIFEAAAQAAAANNEVFDFDVEFNELGINATLKKIKVKKSSLIVRSTGKEDTDTLANAGGNESVPNVAPVASDILRAMGVGEPGKTGVVSSYFSAKSFIQRLDGEDYTLFDLPFTPALIQRMIGERVHGLRSDNVKAFLKLKGIGNASSVQAIKQAIITAANLATFKFNEVFKAEEAQIDEMLGQASTKGWQLCVMSPDGKDKNDAVAANKAGLAQAIANVVAGQIQRAVNFDSAYCAVVIEPVQAGKIIERRLPACGVMFTEEAEGGISKQDLLALGWDFSKQARSTGITFIQASYGHNEGVVNSLVGVDSYFVTDVNSIYSVIRPKPFRKFPSLQVGTKLEDRDNPQELINASALSVSEASLLKTLAVALEHYYYKPMDVEYVIDRSEKVVYLVQARPLVHNKEKVEPSYFQDLDTILFPKYKGSVIGAAGGAVRVITSADHVIAKPTMGEALDTYLKHKNKNMIRCIIVGEHAPATSHEATMFRTAVKPVIFMPQFNKIEDALERRAKLVVDVQQETVIEWQESSVSIKSLTDDGLITQGWRNYPISPQLSLDGREPVDKASLDAEYKEFLQSWSKKGLDPASLASLNIGQGKSIQNLSKGIIRDCFDMMRDDDEKKARTGLILLLGLADRKIRATLSGGLDEDLNRHIILLKKYLLSIGRNVADSLQYPKNSDGYMKRLYYLRFLEALFYQQPPASEVLDAGSLAQSIFKTSKLEKKMITALKGVGAVDVEVLVKKSAQEIELLKKAGNHQELKKIERAKLQVQLAKIQEIALTPLIAQKWMRLVAGFVMLTEQEQKDFISMVNTLAQFDMLPIWLHTSFERLFDAVNLKGTAQQLIQEFQGSEAVFDGLRQRAQEIAQLKPDLFAEPKTYKAQRALLTTLVTYFTSEPFKNLFKNSQVLGKMAILFKLEEFVDIFDKSIKASKTQKSVPIFKEMLQSYFDIIKSVCSLEYSAGFQNASNQLNGQSKLQAVQNSFNVTNNDDAQMNNSPNFDVNIPVIGSVSDYYTGLPKTLEDIFTFIHQSLINVNGWLMKNIGLDTFADQASPVLPSLVKDVFGELYSIMSKGFFAAAEKKVSLMGVSFKGNILSLKFNYPLRSHSSIVMLDYIHNKKLIRLSCVTAGENEWGRFYKIGEYAQTVADILKLECEVKPAKKAVTFSWDITQAKLDGINAKYPAPPGQPVQPGQFIIGKCLEWANDGSSGNNGLSYATDGMNSVKDKENAVFNFITNVLLKDNVDQKHAFAESIIDQSLNQNRVHMYIHQILPLIKLGAAGDPVWTKALQVVERLLVKNSLYATNSDLSFFRFYRSPAYEVPPEIVSTNIYYNVTIENLYDLLKNNNNFKGGDARAQSILQALGIDSFKQAFARRMFNEIADRFDGFTNATKNRFAQLMQKHPEFFAGLRDIASEGLSGVGGYTKNTKLETLLSKSFFNTDPGKSAKSLVAWCANQMKTLNKDFLPAANVNVQEVINKNVEFFLELPNAPALFGAAYPGVISDDLKKKLRKALKIDDEVVQKNVLAILALKDLAIRNQVFVKALKNHGFSWIEQDVVGGMAFPDYVTIQALKAQNVGLVVTLTNEAELPASWFDALIQNVRIPIKDFEAPTIAQVNQVLTRIKQTTDAGKRAVVHCAGGRGRTGTILACWFLKNKNMTAVDAIKKVRKLRPDSIETNEQEDLVKEFEIYLKTPKLDPTVKENIQNHAQDLALNQSLVDAVQEIKMKKVLAQSDNDLKQLLKNFFQQGYFPVSQLRPNILELYTLVSEGAITDQEVIDAAKASVLAALNNTGVADALSPAEPVQREKLANITAVLIQKNILTLQEVLNIFNGAGGTRRKKLLTGYILLKSGYKTQPFLGIIRAYALEPVSQGAAYKTLADACNALAK